MSSALRYFDRSHRYKLDGEWVPSVTGCSRMGKGGNCDGLVNWATVLTAEYAFDNSERLDGMARDEYVGLVSTASKRHTARAIATGVEVHRLAEQVIADLPVQAEPDVRPYVEQAIGLIERHDLMALLVESAVFSRTHLYAGRLDTVARIVTAELGEHVALIDWKTGRDVWTDVGLQMVGYRRAEFAVVDDTDQPMPEVTACYVAHISPDSAELYPVVADDAMWRYFLAARALQPFTSVRRDAVVGDALEHPPALLDGTGPDW